MGLPKKKTTIMKKFLLIIVALLTLSLVTVSCAKNQKAQVLNELAQELNENSTKWTPDQWQDFYVRFDAAIADLEQESLDEEETKAVNQLKDMVESLKKIQGVATDLKEKTEAADAEVAAGEEAPAEDSK